MDITKFSDVSKFVRDIDFIHYKPQLLNNRCDMDYENQIRKEQENEALRNN